MNREIRTLSGGELRADSAGHLVGHAAVFGSESVDLGGFRETILPGAFSRALAERQDVRALVNHQPSAILGRTRSGTLILREDARGLYFDVQIGDTQLGRDIRESVGRGDVDQCSFAFVCPPGGDRWSEGGTKRQLIDVDLIDVSVVTFPAYEATSVAARSLWPDGPPATVKNRLTGDGDASLASYRMAPDPARLLAIPRPRDPVLERQQMELRLRLAMTD